MKILYWRPDQGGQWCIADAPLTASSYIRAATVGNAPLGGRRWEMGPPSGTEVMSTGLVDLWSGWVGEWIDDFTTVTPAVMYDIRSMEQPRITGRYSVSGRCALNASAPGCKVDAPLHLTEKSGSRSPGSGTFYSSDAGNVLFWRDRGPLPEGEPDPCADNFALNDPNSCRTALGCNFTAAVPELRLPPSCTTTARGQWCVADRIGGNLRAITDPAAHVSFEAGPPLVTSSGVENSRWYVWEGGWELEPEAHISVKLGVNYPDGRPHRNTWPVPDPPCGYPTTEHIGVCLEAVQFGTDSVTFTLLEGNRTDAETMLPPGDKLSIPFLADMAGRLFPWRYRAPFLRAVAAEGALEGELIKEEVINDGSTCLNVVGDYFCDCSLGWEGKGEQTLLPLLANLVPSHSRHAALAVLPDSSGSL